MNAKDMISFLEYAKTFNKEPKTKVKKVKEDMTFDDYLKFQKKMKEFQDWQKDQEKLHKKEEKKEEKKGITAAQINILLLMSFPTLGPLYYMWLRSFIH